MAECTVRILPTPAIALVMARKGLGARAAAAAESAFGVALPTLPRIVRGAGVEILWCGPDRWLVFVPPEAAETHGGIEAMLEPVFAGVASATDQSGSRVLFGISGMGARELLSRALPVDLHPRVFGPGHTALCRANYVSLQVWQRDDGDDFVLALPRSYADRQTLLPQRFFTGASVEDVEG